MAIDKQKFSCNFPNRTAPQKLLDLLDFMNSEQIYPVGLSLIDDGTDAIQAWTHQGHEEAARYVVFGSESDGSLIGYWLYDDRSLDQAPIVLLDCDVDGSKVLANSLDDFLALLACGGDEDAFPVWSPYFGKKADMPQDNEIKVREWLKNQHGITPPPDPKAFLEDARKNHPDLKSWILDNYSENH